MDREETQSSSMVRIFFSNGEDLDPGKGELCDCGNVFQLQYTSVSISVEWGDPPHFILIP
jgi:hypothetical protein